MRICRGLLAACFPFVLVAFAAQAGPFSRARTEGQRLDDARPIAVDGLYVYSFLQEGTGDDSRLSKDIGKYLEVVVGTLREKGVRVGAKDMPTGTLTLDAAPRGVNGIEGFERNLDESARTSASAIAREYRDEEAAMPVGYRLLLLPDKVVRTSGLQWGTRKIGSGSGTWFIHGAQASAVPSYSFRVYWLLEDVDDQPIAAGTTTGTLDIRGFPAKPMAEQMASELERLGIGWQGLAR